MLYGPKYNKKLGVYQYPKTYSSIMNELILNEFEDAPKELFYKKKIIYIEPSHEKIIYKLHDRYTDFHKDFIFRLFRKTRYIEAKIIYLKKNIIPKLPRLMDITEYYKQEDIENLLNKEGNISRKIINKNHIALSDTDDINESVLLIVFKSLILFNCGLCEKHRNCFDEQIVNYANYLKHKTTEIFDHKLETIDDEYRFRYMFIMGIDYNKSIENLVRVISNQEKIKDFLFEIKSHVYDITTSRCFNDCVMIPTFVTELYSKYMSGIFIVKSKTEYRSNLHVFRSFLVEGSINTNNIMYSPDDNDHPLEQQMANMIDKKECECKVKLNCKNNCLCICHIQKVCNNDEIKECIQIALNNNTVITKTDQFNLIKRLRPDLLI
jgi:hypothetical protein